MHRVAVDQFEYFGVLENPDPEGFGQPSLTQNQIQRVKMPGAHVHQAAGIHRRADYLLYILRPHQTRFVGVTQRRQVRLLALERRELRRGVGQLAKAPAQVAVDAVRSDTLAHQGHRVDAGALQVTHALLAHVLAESRHVMADTANQLPAVAPAGTPANTAGFQQDHREPALGQFDGGVNAGETAADHAHVGGQVSAQCGSLRQSVGRSPVVGPGVVSRLNHLLVFTLLQARVIRRMVAGVGVVEI